MSFFSQSDIALRELRRAYAEEMRASLVPRQDLTCSQWNEKYRRLGTIDSARAGQWSTDSRAYLREIMDAVSDDTVNTVVAMLASQVGKTAGPILGSIGYFIHQEPSPMLLIAPRVEDAENFSTVRLASMIRETPVLRQLVSESKSRDSGNKILHKQFPGGHILLAGANAPANLAQWSIRVAICDEVDRFPASAGTEGDPIELVRQRLLTFGNRGKLIMVSTPTLEGESRIAIAYEETDKRVYVCGCPFCGHEQELEFSRDDGTFGVRWAKDATLEQAMETARYHCIRCDEPWTEADRNEAVAKNSRWLPTAPFTGRRGFRASSLISPDITWAMLARQWIEAQGDEERIKVFRNLKEAKTYRQHGEAPAWEKLSERREPIDLDAVDQAAVLVTAGVDIQKDRIEVRTWAWAPSMESWALELRVLEGATETREVWDRLDDFLYEATYTRADGAPMPISMSGVDAGYATTEVLEWAKRSKVRRRILLVKGDQREQHILGASKPAELTIRGKIRKTGMRFRIVGVDTAKRWFYARLRLVQPAADAPYPPGWVHLGEWMSDDELQQLTAEEQVLERVKNRAPRYVWKLQPGRRNEGLDCRNYAHAAALHMGIDRRKGRRMSRAEEEAPEEVAAPPEPQQPPEQEERRAPPPVAALDVPRKRRMVARSNSMGWG